MLATTAVLLALLISNQFVQYLTQAASGRLPVSAVLELMSLQVPMLLGLMLPLGFYIGVLMGYGRAYADREITVLAACGLSKAKLLANTLIMALGVSFIVALLMFWVQPHVEWYKHHILQQALNSSPLEKLFPDQFQRFGDGKWVVYADRLSPDHKQLAGIFVAEQGEKGSMNILHAKTGYQQTDPDGDNYIVFVDGERYTGVPGKVKFDLMNFKQYALKIPEFGGPITQKVQAMSTGKLWAIRHQPEASAELQWRAVMPISVLLLALIGVSLSEVKPRQGRYAKLIPAVLIYIVYADLMFVARAWLRKGEIPNYLGMWWVHVLMLMIAAVLIWRFVGWQKFWSKNNK